MDNKTLALTYIIVAVAVFFASQEIAIIRKEKCFKIFAYSFLFSATGIIMIALSGVIPLLFSLVMGNVFMMLNYLMLVCGIRAFYKETIIWQKHFSIYIIIYFFTLVFTTLMYDIFILRVSIYTIFLSMIMIELFFYLRPRLYKVPRLIRISFKIIIFGYLGMYLLRLTLLLIELSTGSSNVNSVKIYGFVLITSIVSLIFWFTALQLLDSFKLLEEMTEKNQLLDLMAQTDKMTGLYNRNYLDQNIDDYMDIADRLAKPISFILLDLDHFKNVNDQFGHAVGDEVLISTANRIKKMIRKTDKVIRWGGEEFLILAIGTTQDNALRFAEKLRNEIASKQYDKVGHVTASFGVAEHIYSETQDMCFKRADLALYKAKNSGRNCVVGWTLSDQLPIELVSIEWLDKWYSGNEVIDKDHRILIELSNELIESTVLDFSANLVKVQIDKIVLHIVQHFKQEEEILKGLSYSELVEHIESHKELVEEMKVAVESYMNNNTTVTDLISFIVGKIVIGHMLMKDTKFYKYTMEDMNYLDK